MIKQAPVTFTPYLKSVIWGGDKICRYKGIRQTQPKIGESWEVSAVPGHESVVDCGCYAGMSITQLASRFGSELLGERVTSRYHGGFPMLVKLIDAEDNLSVQVHPDDALAARRHGCPGKTEMWYVIDSEKGAQIYSGLKCSMTPDEYVDRVAHGTFASTLASYTSAPGDVFYLPAGRVHAIGAGNLLAEIQENSDITYRIYDYDRRDAEGHTRELHTAQARDAIDYRVLPDYRSAPAPDDNADVEIVKCDHFNVRRVIVGDDCMEVKLDPTSFAVIVCLEGTLEIGCPDGGQKLPPGHSALIPASTPRISLGGPARILIAQA